MRTIIFVLTTFLWTVSFAATPSTATVENWRFWERHHPKWYLGAAGFLYDPLYGKSHTIKDLEIAGVSTFENTNYHETVPGSGYQLFFGYEINPLFAAEMKFLQSTGSFKFTLENAYSLDPLTLATVNFFRIGQIAFGPALLFSIPFTPYFTPYLKGGFYIFYYHREYTTTNAPSSNDVFKANYWEMRLIEGFGIKSQLTTHFGLRLEYECPVNPVIDTRLKLLMGDLNLSAYVVF